MVVVALFPFVVVALVLVVAFVPFRWWLCLPLLHLQVWLLLLLFGGFDVSFPPLFGAGGCCFFPLMVVALEMVVALAFLLVVMLDLVKLSQVKSRQRKFQVKYKLRQVEVAV